MSDVNTNIGFTEDKFGHVDSAILEQTQYISDDFLRRQADMREWSKHNDAGEYHEVAAVPMAKILEWQRQGFDAMQAPVKEVVQRLKAEELAYLLSTSKKL